MPNIALITGASSGIGREMARYHASKGGDLIITARRAAELESLKAELEARHGVQVMTVPLDIAGESGAEALYQATRGQTIEILINNAGFGGHGEFLDRGLKSDEAMINLNITALVRLCHLIGGDMVARGKGKVLNVSSTAAYQPGPLQATYFATKAFVSSLSCALDYEWRPHGVTVTALEPGFVKTEFAEVAAMTDLDVTKTGATAESVAKFGYDAMLKGKLRVINDRKMRFMLNWIVPLLPRRMVLKAVHDMQTK
ncbi:SDR family NAD(P)-dependent oxidoreductase [Hoeflea ulvae]|uniref:SDR family oxidoreductase n=1 Tax=Hoeflea ulvae TaxID=2983764 RepID=A0ABT3YHV5_9HYPH|nr:SDR family oxidoreductase [Hoeflea ulvae]MCY0095484.1 SDR family oxidoreductase [Hoeflea ulvae]